MNNHDHRIPDGEPRRPQSWSVLYDDEPTDSFFGAFLLSLLLITVMTVLRLCSAISWSWLWILAPGWMPLAVLLYVDGFGALFAEGLDRFVLTPMMDRRQQRMDERRREGL